MIKKILLCSCVLLLMTSCSSTRQVASKKKPIKTKSANVKTPKVNHTNKINTTPNLATKVIWTAVTYKGVPYKYGGMSKKGMDCSGLIYTSFKQRGVTLPRTSNEQFYKGKAISLNKVQKGDLLFFKTSRKRAKVNHVGLVTSVKNGEIYFIHATSSRGVLVSSLNEKYWNRAFIKAKRII